MLSVQSYNNAYSVETNIFQAQSCVWRYTFQTNHRWVQEIQKLANIFLIFYVSPISIAPVFCLNPWAQTPKSSKTSRKQGLLGWNRSWQLLFGTGKSLSEILIFASTNLQYDKRLSMELPWKLQAQNMVRTCSCRFHGNSMNNVLSYFGLVDAWISASEKDLPVFAQVLCSV